MFGGWARGLPSLRGYPGSPALSAQPCKGFHAVCVRLGRSSCCWSDVPIERVPWAPGEPSSQPCQGFYRICASSIPHRSSNSILSGLGGEYHVGSQGPPRIGPSVLVQNHGAAMRTRRATHCRVERCALEDPGWPRKLGNPLAHPPNTPIPLRLLAGLTY